MNSYDDYPTIDTQVVGQTQVVDPTQPGQLAVIPPESQQGVVEKVYRHLPARKQTPQSMNALLMCLVQAPNDFADIARRHNVGPTTITVHNTQNHHLTTNNHYQQDHYLEQYDQRSYQPTFQPVYSPTIEFKPVINVDANALAHSRSHQDNSGAGDNKFWILVFAAIGIFAVGGVMK